MNRRLKKIESKLNLDKEQIVVIIKAFESKEGLVLSNPVEEWLTYPEALEKLDEQNGIIVLNEGIEIQARKAAKLSNNGAARQ